MALYQRKSIVRLNLAAADNGNVALRQNGGIFYQELRQKNGKPIH
jgi:hypothetical protein